MEAILDKKLKLNLGCGRRQREGFLNVDSQAGCNPDVVLDLESAPWPWPDDSVDEVDLVHVLEHLGQAPATYLGIMKELWRVCCNGARVRIVVPHPRSDEFQNDPTHVRPITEAGLEMFSQRANALWAEMGAANTPLGYYLGIDFEIESVEMELKPRWREKLQRGEVGEADIRLAAESQFNVFSQLTAILRAVKPAGGRAAAGEPEREAGAEPFPPGETAAAWGGALEEALAGGDGAGAITILDNALFANPADHEARANLAAVQHALGDLEAAYGNYRALAEAGAGGFGLYNNLGVVALELGRPAEAVSAFEQARALDPAQRTVRVNLAEALGEAGRVSESVAAYEALIAEDPKEAAVYAGLARLFVGQGWFADALKALDMARAFGMDDAELFNQRGIALRELGRFDESLACFEQGLARAPGNVQLLLNLANALARLGRDQEAEAAYRELLATTGEAAPQELLFAYACFLLKRGRTDEGWAFYESRRNAPGVKHHPLEKTVPQWRGETPGPQSALLITAEQGFGDNIQFLPLVGRIAERFGRVCVQTRPALLALVARSLGGVCEVVEQVAEGDHFDWICPIASLPLALRLPVEAWTSPVPYLKADPMQSALWGFRIPAGTQKKVGLCWSGGKSPRYRHRCDLPLPLVDQLLSVSAVRWISLQKEGDEAWRQERVRAGRLIDMMDLAASFDETAALIGNLDLVVTVDTAIAHLAAALGKPVWLLLAMDADWRWLETRSDSPWYPGMRIFRQPVAEDWASLGAQVARELAQLA